MVFPKPGLKYRYQYKLPDSVQRPKKQCIRDHTKIYDLLSDEDLVDIRGAGLAKLDKEEAALFDKEAKLNGKGTTNDKTTTPETNGQPNSTDRTKKRATLMGALKSLRQELNATNEELNATNEELNATNEIKQESSEDSYGSPPKLERQDILVINVKKGAKNSKKVTNRGKKRKLGDSQERMTETMDSNTTPESIVQPKDDSSKENEEEGVNALTLRYFSDRVKEPLANMTSSEVVWKRKSWRNSNTTVEADPCAKPIAKKSIPAEDEIDGNETTDRSIKLPSSNELPTSSDRHQSKTVARPSTSKKKKSQKSKKGRKRSNSASTVAKLPPVLTMPATISKKTAKRKPRGPYKKRAPKTSAKQASRSKRKTSKPRVPQKQLSTTQISRRMRYAIEKHFAKMPGTSYRCPRLEEKAHSRENNDSTGRQVWWCLVCHKEEFDEKGDVMIGCDGCEDWYHLRCIGVPDEKYPENLKWYCRRCMARAIQAGSFDPSKFPLNDDSNK